MLCFLCLTFPFGELVAFSLFWPFICLTIVVFHIFGCHVVGFHIIGCHMSGFHISGVPMFGFHVFGFHIMVFHMFVSPQLQSDKRYWELGNQAGGGLVTPWQQGLWSRRRG